MAEKKTQLSIVISTVDRATAKIKAISERLDKATKPLRDFKEALGDLREKSGLDDVISGFGGVGSAIMGILGKVALIGGAIAAATAGMLGLVAEFSGLGDKAEALGVSVDFLAQTRYAADRAGASAERLDKGFENLSKSMGEMRANKGPLVEFLSIVSPALLQQLKATKSNEEAFNLLADAMAKVKDPAKRAALAQKTFGDATLATLLSKGSKGIKELRDEYADLAGPMGDAASNAGDVDAEMKKLKASTDGIKAALLVGLAPALKMIVERLSKWFAANRGNVKAWAEDLGKRIPDAVEALIDAVRSAIDFLEPFFNSSTKIKIALGVLAAVITGPLIGAIVNLGIALLSTPVGWILAGIAALAVAWYVVITRWDEVKAFFVDFWDGLVEKFGWAAHIIKLALWPILGAATLLIGAWEPVSSFFVGLWGGVKSAFEAAWKYIEPIVEKISDAVGLVKDAIDTVTGSVSGKVEGEVARIRAEKLAEAQKFFGVGGTRAPASEARITIDINGAPPGTRVTADPRNTADVDMSTGYQLIPGML